MKATAKLRYMKGSAQKVRLVADLVRGKKVNDAVAILRHTKKVAARDLLKTLQSAVANAEQKEARLDVDAPRGPQDHRRQGTAGEAGPAGADGPRLPRPAPQEPRDDRTLGRGVRSSMGQKVHPYGFRLGFNRTWHSRWFSTKDYLKFLHEDLKLRKELKGRLSHAGVSEIDIERFAGKLKVNIQTSRPGIIIGKRGAEVDKLRDELQKRTNTRGPHQHHRDPAPRDATRSSWPSRSPCSSSAAWRSGAP